MLDYQPRALTIKLQLLISQHYNSLERLDYTNLSRMLASTGQQKLVS